MPFANGYSMASNYNLDRLGWMYITIATIWTIILIIGMTFLLARRDHQHLRIRNVPLAVSAVATLHIYWVLCLLAYTFNGFYPCVVEYWIMSIYLPLGMALFQASNTQLLYIVNVQRKYTTEAPEEKRLIDSPRSPVWTNWLRQLRAQNRVKRTMTCIACAICVQVVVAMIVFCVSRKFHPSFGLTGSNPAELSRECPSMMKEYNAVNCVAAERIGCRHGWQWIPSILWQFFWAWFYAPYLLWEVRGVHDTHGWRKQTIVCCCAGLFATPMWLIAVYVKAMGTVNQYFIPALWFAMPVFLMETCLIFVPIWNVLSHSRLQSETLEIISEWESKKAGSSLGGTTLNSGASHADSRTSMKSKSTVSSCRGEMYTMNALEAALRSNPRPLLNFAASRDFTGENIAFLTAVLKWRQGWQNVPRTPTLLNRITYMPLSKSDEQIRRQQFKHAVDIYATFVSLKYSDFPVNISHVHLKELQTLFESAALTLYGPTRSNSDANSATPFDEPTNFHFEQRDAETGHASTERHSLKSDASTELILSKVPTTVQTFELNSAAVDSLPDSVLVPDNFGPEVFDHSDYSIKYMVLTNTWIKFVKAGYANKCISDKKSWIDDVRELVFTKNDEHALS